MLYGRFFTFLPQIREFLLDTVFPERAVCRACGRVSGGGVLCPECESHLRNDGFSMDWSRAWTPMCSAPIPVLPAGWCSA